MRIARFISGILVLIAFTFSAAFAFPLYNRFRVSLHRADYHPATFVVEGADFYPAQGDSSRVYWLNGRVDNHAERFIPDFPRNFNPQNADDILLVHPRGSKIDVLYNPHETETIMQFETLRVLPAAADFWREQARRRNKLLYLVFVPLTSTLAVYFLFCYLHLRGWQAQNARPA